MLKAIIIDDEVDCIKTLALLIQKQCPEIEIICQCDSGKSGLKAIKQFKPDVVFLDIDMPYMNGFEMLELAQPVNFDVIFTTAYDKYAVEAFRISAVDYLLKPIDEKQLKEAVSKVYFEGRKRIAPKHIEFILGQLKDVETNNVKRIALPSSDRLILAEFSNIIYCQSDGNYSRVFLKNNKRIYTSIPLIELEESLCNYHFNRVHNQYIINLNEVSEYVKSDGGYLVMSNGDKVNVSRSKKEEILSLIK